MQPLTAERNNTIQVQLSLGIEISTLIPMHCASQLMTWLFSNKLRDPHREADWKED